MARRLAAISSQSYQGTRACLSLGRKGYIRKERKRVFRTKWHVQINAASRGHGVSYSILTSLLKKSNIGLNRKMLAVLASEYPNVFDKVVEKARK